MEGLQIYEHELEKSLTWDFFDVLLIYNKLDESIAFDFKEKIIQIGIEFKYSDIKVSLLDFEPNVSKFKYFEELLDRSTFIFVLVTDNYCKFSDGFDMFLREVAHTQCLILKDKEWCFLPVYLFERNDNKVPVTFSHLCGIKAYLFDNSEKFIKTNEKTKFIRMIKEKSSIRSQKENEQKNLLNIQLRKLYSQKNNFQKNNILENVNINGNYIIIKNSFPVQNECPLTSNLSSVYEAVSCSQISSPNINSETESCSNSNTNNSCESNLARTSPLNGNCNQTIGKLNSGEFSENMRLNNDDLDNSFQCLNLMEDTVNISNGTYKDGGQLNINIPIESQKTASQGNTSDLQRFSGIFTEGPCLENNDETEIKKLMDSL